MASRELKVEIIGDSKSLQKALGSATDSSSKFGTALGKIGKAAALGLGALAVGAAVAGKKMVSLASDAAEVDSKLDVTFRKTLPAVSKELDKFSEATGASRYELREQAADMGALLVPLSGTRQEAAKMSTQFVELATDLSSFNNVPVSDALLAIRSGLVGEAEPLRRFGVLLNEAAVKAEAYSSGIAKTGAELTEQQKVQARANLIMEQTTLAQGDATRTSGSMANQLRALQNNLRDAATDMGKLLLPAALAVVRAFNEHWPEIEQIAKRVMAALVDVAGRAIETVRRNFTQIKAVAAGAFEGALSAGRKVVDFFRTDFGQQLGLGLAAIVALNAATKTFGVSLGDLGKILTLTARNPFFLLLIPLGLLVGDLTRRFIDQKIAAAELNSALDRLAGSTNALKDAQQSAKQAALDLAQAKTNERRTNEDLTKAQRDYNAALRQYGPESKQAKQAHETLIDAKHAEAQADLDLTRSQSALNAALREVRTQVIGGTQELFKLTAEAVKANGTFAEDATARRYADALHEAGQRAGETAVKMGGLDTAAGRARVKTALMADTAADLAVKLGRVPTRKEIIAEAKTRNVQAFYSELDKMVSQTNATAGSVLTAADLIGQNLMAGVESGIRKRAMAGVNAVVAAINQVLAAARAAAGTKSPSVYMAEVGVELMRGAEKGIDQAKGDAAKKAAEAMRDAIQKAIDAVEGASGSFNDAFSSLAESALSAFDSAMEAWVPPAQRLLDKRQLAQQTAELKQAITDAAADLKDANKELRDAIAGGDPEEIAAARDSQLQAQRDYNAAVRAQEDFHLQQLADKQQVAHDKRVARQRIHLQEEIDAISAKNARILNNESLSAAEKERLIANNNNNIRKLLKDMGVDSEFWGSAIGIGMAHGLEKAISSVTTAANKLARAIQKLLKLKSPAEEGPLSDVDVWWDDLGPMLAASVLRGAPTVKAAGTALARSLITKDDTDTVISSFADIAKGIADSTSDSSKSLDDFNKVKDDTRDNVTGLGSDVKKTTDTVKNTFPTVFASAADAMEPFNETLDDTIAKLQSVNAWAQEAAASVIIFGQSAGGETQGLTLPAPVTNPVAGVPLPAFQTGGIVPGPRGRPRIVIAHGGEEVIPVGGGRGTGGSVINNWNFPNYVGDKRELQKAMQDANADYMRRNGSPLLG